MLIATLSAALVGGGYDDIIAIGIVANEEEGEFWFCNNKPTDGTQVDYVLHNISEVFAAPDLLAACEAAFDYLPDPESPLGLREKLYNAIYKAER